MSSRRGWIDRFAAVALGTLCALVLVEALLQAGALAVRLVAPRAEATAFAGLGDTRRVLSLGDSNTYGLYVGREQAYPQVLQRIWNESHPELPIETINLGFPGTNSSTIRDNLPGLLRHVNPDLVILLVGVNDLWTKPEPVGRREADTGPDLWTALYRHSRLYRLWFMRTRSVELPILEGDYSVERPLGFEARRVRVEAGGEPFEFGFEPAGDEVADWEQILSDNLEHIVAATTDYGVALILLTYLSDQVPYHHANRALRHFASTHASHLIDTGAELLPRCPDGHCAELLSDQHPSAAGYELVARALLRELERSP